MAISIWIWLVGSFLEGEDEIDEEAAITSVWKAELSKKGAKPALSTERAR
jgi:hypothetical protein